jgi:hypothetical protein
MGDVVKGLDRDAWGPNEYRLVMLIEGGNLKFVARFLESQRQQCGEGKDSAVG